MGTSLSGLTPATTFDGLLKVGDNDPLTADLKAISDGAGNDSAIELSTGELKVIGQATIAGLTNNTSASAILAQNSDGYNLLQVRNDGTTIINNNSYSFSQPRFTSTKEIVIHQGLSVGQTAAPTAARLHVKGSGNDNTTTSLLVQNSEGTQSLKVTDDGIVNLGNSNITVDGSSIKRGSTEFSLSTLTSLTSYSGHLFKAFDGAAYTEVMRIQGGSQSVGIGETTPAARLHVKGAGNDNTTTALLVQNSDAVQLVKVNDEGSTTLKSLNLQGNAYFGGYTYGPKFYIKPSGQTKIGEGSGNDDGVQLQVKGSGNDATTTALLVQNSDGDELFKVQDDGITTFIADGGSGSIPAGFELQPYASANPTWGPSIKSYYNNNKWLQIKKGASYYTFADAGLGINMNATPSAELHIKGSGSSSSSYALKVNNSDSTAFLNFRDDGLLQSKVTSTSASKTAFQLLDLNGDTLFRVFANKTGYITGDFGVGNDAPTARLHVKGSGNDNTTISLLVQNSDGNQLIRVRDDAQIQLGQSSNFTIDGVTTYNRYGLVVGSTSSVANTRMFVKGSGTTSATNSLLVQNSSGVDIIKVKDNQYTEFPSALWYTYSTSGISYIRKQGTTPLSLYINGSSFLELSTSGVGIGQSNAAAKLHIKGSGNDNTTTALLVQNSDATELLKVLDNGATDIGGGNTTISLNPVTNYNIQKFQNLYYRYTDGTYLGRMDNDGLQIGNGVNAPTARLQVKGSGATSATTALLVENSAGADILKVNDAGQISTTGSMTAGYFAAGNSIVGSAYARVATTKLYASASGAGINVQANATSAQPDASAILQADSTTQGFLPPRMTTGEKNAIASPAAGLMVYDTDANQMSYWNGSSWINF